MIDRSTNGRRAGTAPGSTPGRLPGRLRTGLVLLGVQAALRLLGFRRVCALLERGVPETVDRPLAPTEEEHARTLARRLERAAGFRFFRIPCLARALLLRRWLAVRGLPARLRIGVRRPGGASPESPPLHAHAWVECGHLALDPDEGVGERFAPLD